MYTSMGPWAIPTDDDLCLPGPTGHAIKESHTGQPDTRRPLKRYVGRATSVETTGNVTVLPPAGREDQMERWCIAPDRTGGRPRTTNRGLGSIFGACGYSVTSPKNGGADRRGGLTTHSGAAHPDEFVDEALLTAMAEEALGFTAAEVRGVYRQGIKSDAQRGLRTMIDARLLEVAESGGCLTDLARVLGVPVDESTHHCRSFDRALARARAARGAVAA